MRTELKIALFTPLFLALSGCGSIKNLSADISSMVSGNENKTNKEIKITDKKSRGVPLTALSNCGVRSRVLSNVIDMSQGECRTVPEEYRLSYINAINSLKSEDWKALNKETSVASKVSVNRYGSEHYATIVILTLQAFNVIENGSVKESASILEEVMRKRRSLIGSLEESVRSKVSKGEFHSLQSAVREKLPATELYLSGYKKKAGQFYNHPLMEMMILRYTTMEKVDPAIHEVDLFIASIQLTTYAAVKINDGEIDEAYDALLSVSMIDEYLMGNLGFIERKQGSSLALEDLINMPSGKAAKDLREIMILSGNGAFKEAYVRSKKWVGMYENSSSKMKGFAYYMLASASEELKHKGSKQNYKNALKYFNNGFGEGNFMSALIDYMLLSEIIGLEQRGGVKRGEMYHVDDAKQRIKIINNWRRQYVGKVPENKVFENMLLIQLGMLHFGADIPTDDSRLQSIVESWDGVEAKMNSGDMSAAMAAMMDLPKMMVGSEADIKRIEQIPIQYFNVAISDNQRM